MSRMIGTLLAAALFLPLPALADERPIVVVFDVETKGLKLSQVDQEGLSDYLASRLAESGRFQVVPRDQLKERLMGQKRASFKECYDQSCRIELGRELAAEKTLATKIIKLGSRCTISASLFDLRRATTDRAATAMGKCDMDELVNSMDKAVDKLTGTPEAPPKPPEKPVAAIARLDSLPQQAPGARPNLRVCNAGDLNDCRSQCEAGSPQSCYRFGRIFRLGQSGQRQDAIQAARYYTKACDWDWPAACSDLGYMVEKGIATQQSLPRALQLYQRGCDGGYALGCRNVAVFLENGMGTVKDLDRASQYYERACSGGDMGGCNGMGFGFEMGHGRPQSYSRAVEYYQKGCDGGYGLACKNLAIMYERGKGTAVDLPRAGALYKKACGQGNMSGCNGLGVAYERGWGFPIDMAQSVINYTKACEGLDWLACKNLASMYENGRGVAKDTTRARNLYKSACDHAIADGCNGYAFAVERGWGGFQKDYKSAASLYQKACDLGSMVGCSNLGIFYRDGFGLVRDRNKAWEFFDKSCKMGRTEACKWRDDLR